MIVRAFRDFWLDCYSTMLFSILLSYTEIDRVCLYSNSYIYSFADIEDLSMREVRYGVKSRMDVSEIEKKLLYDDEMLFLNIANDPIAEIKNRIDNGKIVMAGVDLFYWVDETFHFGKNHVFHYSLVFSYDESTKELIVLETGESGYGEYRVSYKQAIVALKAYHDYSKSYRVSADSQSFVLTKEIITTNAKKIIKSIDSVLEQDEKILNMQGLSDDGILYMNDMVQTHMFNMSNRSKVNGLLFKYAFTNASNVGYNFCSQFRHLEEQFELLKNLCILNGYKSKVGEWLPIVKAKMTENIYLEKGIWEKYLLYEKELQFALDKNR